MEPHESFSEAAARGLKEETGLELEDGSLAAPTWYRDVIYSYRGERRLQHESIAIARFNVLAPAIRTSQRVAFESEGLFDYRWWRPQDIATARERFPVQLARLPTGETITEPLETWP